ncbi:HNH endonuclease [Collimonas arenae]|uniref:HNH endonuclease n=1 Tax=Collimonas arenae TaxID=279058 RepID=UPI001969DAE1|nr:hypothetical protein [Collimonas arenae]
MQAFIDYIFYDVWCKTPGSGPFDLNLFNTNAELREVMEAFYYSDAQGADFFYGHVERIYGLFSPLTAAQINQFKQWYQGNNDLEKVCTNDPTAQLARYTDIAVTHQNIAVQLGNFFKGLYSPSLLGLVALSKKIGDINEHYHNFVTTNKTGKCPFCGIGDIKGEHHSKREAYDHYLPKALYPFNSINFRNLAPACHECNSTYKLSKDPMYGPAGRRKAFYPYAAAGHAIEIQVVLLGSDVARLTPAEVSLHFGPEAINEEIDTWRDVYGIEERYKAKLCGENDGKYWIVQVLDECLAYDKQPADILNMRTQQANSRPYADCNFLRKPFLDACQKIGVF